MDIILLIVSIILVLSLLIFIPFLFLKEVLFCFGTKCNLLREFISKNNGFFTILFVFIFFIQQLLLTIISYLLKVDSKTQILIGVFALIILTTATIEKFILEKKFQYQKSEVDVTSYENQEMLKDLKEISQSYERLYDKYKKLKQKR